MKPNYPFLGIGMSANIAEAQRIARERLEGSPWYPVDMLNLGLNSEAEVPPGFESLMADAGLTTVGHVEEVNLVGPPDEQRLSALDERCKRLGMTWLEQDLGVWTWNGARLGNHMIAPLLDQKSLDESTRVMERVAALISVPFLVENPPFYAVHGDLDVLSYLQMLHDRTGCGLLLDIGHLIGYCMLTDRDPCSYLDQWACDEEVVELHIAGYDVQETSSGVYWTDAHHRELSPFALKMLELALQKFSHVKAITLEAECAPPEVIERGIAALREVAGVQEVSGAH